MRNEYLEVLMTPVMRVTSSLSKSSENAHPLQDKSLNDCRLWVAFAVSGHESLSVGLDTSTSCLFYESILS